MSRVRTGPVNHVMGSGVRSAPPCLVLGPWVIRAGETVALSVRGGRVGAGVWAQDQWFAYERHTQQESHLLSLAIG